MRKELVQELWGCEPELEREQDKVMVRVMAQQRALAVEAGVGARVRAGTEARA